MPHIRFVFPRFLKFLPILSVGLFLACKTEPKEQADVVIINARIIDVETGQVSPPQSIVIRNDSILEVTKPGATALFEARTIVDAKDGFVMPGLWDNHVHFRGGDTLIGENKKVLPLFLAYGVTTVRDAGGDLTPSVMEWRDAIAHNQLPGPDIFTSGPKFDGSKPAWPGSIPIDSAYQVNPAMDSLMKIKVDYFKIYDGNLTPEIYYELIKEAEARNMRITGHMPLSADLMKGVDLGLDGIEHMYYLLNEASPVGDSIRSLNIGYGGLPELLRTYNDSLAEEAFKKLAEKEFYVTPTLHIGHVLAGVVVEDHSQDTLLSYIGSGIEKTYARRVNSAKRQGDAGRQQTLAREQRFNAMVSPLNKAGVHLLAGSDCGAFNSFVYPGASIQEELFALVKAGLSPAEALKTSMVNGPRFFNLQEKYGSVAPGKMANLILLTKNPLDRIENLKTLQTVIKRGKVFEKSELQTMLESVKR